MRLLHKIRAKFRMDTVDYGKYIIAEFADYLTYINAIAIGIAVNYLSGLTLPGKPAPYIVPLFVQALSKSAVKFRHRHLRRLLQLPSEREDPVFIMGEEGNILLATGVTNKTFTSYNVGNIADFIDERSLMLLKNRLADDAGSDDVIEVCSHRNGLWYELKLKPMRESHSVYNEYLVWFVNITRRKDYEGKLVNILKLTRDIHSLIQQKIRRNILYTMLAEFVLDNGYEGVFMSRLDEGSNIIGFAFQRESDKTVQSDLITIDHESEFARFCRSLVQSNIAFDAGKKHPDSEIAAMFPPDRGIGKFFSFPLINVVLYHDSGMALAGFNKDGGPTRYDRVLMEIIANNIRTLLDIFENIYYNNHSSNGEK